MNQWKLAMLQLLENMMPICKRSAVRSAHKTSNKQVLETRDQSRMCFANAVAAPSTVKITPCEHKYGSHAHSYPSDATVSGQSAVTVIFIFYLLLWFSDVHRIPPLTDFPTTQPDFSSQWINFNTRPLASRAL